jgi:hypothetical protein
MSAPALALAAAGLMSAASAAGLIHPAVYRDNLLVRSGWFGNDLATLAAAVPVLAASAIAARRGQAAAALVMLGMLDYAVYNYAFYLFGAAFNGLFLVYAAIVVIAAVALIAGLAGVDAARFRSAAAGGRVRGVAAWMLLVALALGGFWIATSFEYVFTARVPGVVEAVGHPTNVIAALDLTMVVPPMAIGGAWLWQRRPWGYVIAVVANVKGAAYMLALCAATLAAVRAGPGDAVQLALWVPVGIGSLIASAVLLRRV